jgi:methyltransferase
MTAVLALAAVLALMLAELIWSRRNERRLRARGAVAVEDPVYATMQWAYPGAFVAMGLEAWLSGPPPAAVSAAGALTFLLGKLLKYWAIVSLGERWTYKVFVLPDAPLVTTGPYRHMRHPNYIGVVGELAGVALFLGARMTGPLGVAFFSWLLTRRIRAEEKALN